ALAPRLRRSGLAGGLERRGGRRRKRRAPFTSLRPGWPGVAEGTDGPPLPPLGFSVRFFRKFLLYSNRTPASPFLPARPGNRRAFVQVALSLAYRRQQDTTGQEPPACRGLGPRLRAEPSGGCNRAGHVR